MPYSIYTDKFKRMKIIAIIDDNRFGAEYINKAVKVAPYADIIWYRIKNKDARLIYNNCIKLRKALPDSRLVLSSRADIASLAGFDGVHLNSDDLSPDIVKQTFPKLIIGYSSHSLNECLNSSADYCTLSPIFETKKDYECRPLGLLNAPRVNVFALGGIDVSNYKLLQSFGYVGIAGISLCDDIEKFSK